MTKLEGNHLRYQWPYYLLRTAPLIYLVTPAKHTVTQGLINFCSGPYAGTDYHYLFAALCTVSIPIIVIFLMFQNLFISGITAGSVKE